MQIKRGLMGRSRERAAFIVYWVNIVAKQKAIVESAPTNGEDRLLEFKEAAAQIGVDVRTIFRWANIDIMGRRRLKTVRFPSGRRKVRQSVINQILQATGQNGDATEEMSYDDPEAKGND
jgi:hypothetical protein